MAQHPLQTDGQVVAASGDAVPGVPGATFGGAGFFDLPVVDALGNVVFRGRFFGGATTAADERALFVGTAGNLTKFAQGGDPAPGMPVGVTLSTSAGAPGFTSTYRVGPNGEFMGLTSLWNGAVGSNDDTAILVGPPSNLSILVRESDAAPGTVGAQFVTDFTSTTFVSNSTLAVQATGRYLFKSQLIGGDVVGITNNDGWWLGAPGALQLLVRKGDVMPGAGGFVITSLTNATSPYFAKLNAAGQVLWEGLYSSTFGTPLPTGLDNQVLYLSTVGGNHTLVAREGDPVPGLSGGEVLGATSGASTWGATGTSLDAGGNVVFRSEIRGGSTTSNDDTVVLYRASNGAMTLVMREDDPAPGLSGVQLGAVTSTTLQLNDHGTFVCVASLRGVNVTTSNDTSLWAGDATTPGGAMQLIAREGDLAPDTLGATISGISTSLLAFNNLGTCVVVLGLVGGDVVGATNDSALYQWSASGGLTMIGREGDAMPQLGNQTITGWSINTSDNTATSNLGFNQSNRLVLRLVTGSGQSIVTYDVPYVPTPTSYCTAGTTTNGCNATISATGSASLSAASGFVLQVTNVEGAKTGLIFYGLDNTGFTPAQWSATSTSYLCVKPPTQRTASQQSGGTTGACDGALSIDWLAYLTSVPGALGQPFTPGSTVFAQAWFRDPPAAKSTSLSDALEFETLP